MRNKPTTPNAIRFMEENPSYMGTVHGVDLYEDPWHGDQDRLLAVTKDGRLRRTAHWKVPAAEYADDLKTL